MYERLKEIEEKIAVCGKGHYLTTVENVSDIGEAGLIEAASDHNEEGLIPIKLTAKGLRYLAENIPVPTVNNPTEYEIESGFAIPPVKRKPNSKSEKYPFSSMEVDQSFHVPVSEKCPNPGKSLQTAVSAATSRYKIEDPEGGTTKNRKGDTIPLLIKTREYSLRTVGIEDPNGPGARIYRIK